MEARNNAAGLAALDICESLLLALSENGVLQPGQARAVFEDATAAHRNAAALEAECGCHPSTMQCCDAI